MFLRRFLTKTFLSGDAEKALKLSLMMAHPKCSDNIWTDLGMSIFNADEHLGLFFGWLTPNGCSVDFAGIHYHLRAGDSGLAETDRNEYYKSGFRDIVKNYSKWDLINQHQSIQLLKWVKKDLFLDTSMVEYNEIIHAIKDAKENWNMSRDRIWTLIPNWLWGFYYGVSWKGSTWYCSTRVSDLIRIRDGHSIQFL